jgi:hypothetical protein
MLMASAPLAVFACKHDSVDTREAQVAAELWLADLDRGDYTACWERAAPRLREREQRQSWQRALELSRAAMGPIIGRALAESHPGKATAGRQPFVNLVFRVDRSSGRSAGEFISVERGTDGQWRVLGYRAVGLTGEPGSHGH